MKRHARTLACTTAVAALLAAPALADDDDGAGFLTRLLQDQLSDAGREVRIIGFRGALSSRATIDELRIADDDGVWLVLRDAVLDWNRAALFRGALEVNELSVREIDLARAPGTGPGQPPAPEATPFALPELPVSIRVGEIRADAVRLGEPLLGAETVVRLDGTATLAGGAGSTRIAAERIDGAEGVLRLEGSFDNQSRELALDVKLTEGPDGIVATLLDIPDSPSLRLAVAGDGPLSDFRAEIALDTAGVPRLTGDVTLREEDDGARAFRAALEGDIAPLFAPDFQQFFGDEVRLLAEGAALPDGRFRLDTLDLVTQELQLAGNLALGPTGLPERVALDGTVASRDGSPVLLPLAGPRTTLDRASLSIAFDAAASDDWDADITVTGLTRPDLVIDRLALTGTGRLTAEDGMATGATGRLDFAAEGLTPEDPALAAALGSEVTGRAVLDWADGRPLTLSDFALEGDEYGVAGSATLEGDRLAGAVTARLDALERFSALADRPLSGAAMAEVSGTAELLSGAFDAVLAVTGEDLRLDIAEADALLAGTSRIDGRVRRGFEGTEIEGLTVVAQTLSARIDGILRSTGSDLDAVLDFADLSVLGDQYGGALLAKGRLVAENGAQRVDFTATGRDLAFGIEELDGLLAGESRIALEAAIDGPDIEIARFDLAATSLSAEVSGRLGEGTADIAGQFDFADLGVLGADYGGRIAGEGRFTEIVGVQRVTFTAAGQDLSTGIAEVDGLIGGDSRLALDASRQGEVIDVARFSIDAAQIAAEAAGRIAPEGSDFTGRLALPDLAALGPQYGGSVRVEGSVSDAAGTQRINATATATDLRVGIAEADRMLAGETRLALQAARSETGIAIDRAVLATATGLSAQASGQVLPGRTEIDFAADLASLGAVQDGLSGRLRAEGSLSDIDGVRRVDATGTATDLRLGVAEADRLLAGQTRLAVTAGQDADGLTLERSEIATATGLTLRAAGRLAEGASDLTAEAVLESLGALGPRYGGRLTADARLTERNAERTLTLQARGENLATGIFEADQLLRGTSQLSLEASQLGERLRVRSARLSTPQLTAEANATVEGTTRQLDLSARLGNLALLVPGFDGPVTVSGSINDAPGNAYSVDLRGTGPGGIDARVNGRIARDLTAALAITGTGNLALANRVLDPTNLQGPARFDLRLDGRPSLERLSGTVSTTGARIVAPGPGLTLEQIDATASLGGGAIGIDAEGSVQDGGRVSLGGQVQLAPRFPADLTLGLRNARLTDRRIFETRVSGDLRVGGELIRGGRITGALTLADTELRIPSTGLGGAGYAPPGIIHLGEPAAVRETRLRARINGDVDAGQSRNPFDLDVSVSSPNRVFIRGRGLDAELGGTLLLTGTTDDVVPSGEFTLLRGRLDILGRRFVLSEGLARLQGRFVPFVRLTATTSTDGITASIVVEGEADALGIAFLSVPELPEEEVVARILFGRGLDRISAFQAAQLASAVATLAGRGGEGVVGRLRQGFGLDDLDVSTTEDGAAAVRAGRYLTENIYTDVTVDSEGRSEVSINLDVSRSVTVRARTDSTGRSGLGIFFERDY